MMKSATAFISLHPLPLPLPWAWMRALHSLSHHISCHASMPFSAWLIKEAFENATLFYCMCVSEWVDGCICACTGAFVHCGRVCASTCMCVRACVRAFVRACVCVRARTRPYHQVDASLRLAPPPLSHRCLLPRLPQLSWRCGNHRGSGPQLRSARGGQAPRHGALQSEGLPGHTVSADVIIFLPLLERR